jgi:hypothetical protein
MVLAGDVEEISNDVEGDEATVKAAFSRKRGFTKKVKKTRKEEQTELSE